MSADSRVVSCELCRNGSGQIYWVTKPDLPDMPLGEYVQLALLAEAESDRDSWLDQSGQRLKDWDDMRKERDALQSRLDAVGALADRCATWLPDGNDPIGPLHGAGMAFAYRDVAKAIRAALGCATTGEGE